MCGYAVDRHVSLEESSGLATKEKKIKIKENGLMKEDGNVVVPKTGNTRN